MDVDGTFLATVITNSRAALAAFAAGDLLEQVPAAAEGFAPDPFERWQEWLASRLDELAVAATLDRPALWIDQVQWARTTLTARGIAAGHFRAGLERLAAVLARELPAAAGLAAARYVQAALAEFDRPWPSAVRPPTGDTPAGRLVTAYLLALMEGDRRKAIDMIRSAAKAGQSVQELYLRVLMPAQEEVGRLWLLNEASVADEHFVTATTRQVMAELAQFAPYRSATGKLVLAAAVTGNLHDIGIQAVADFFQMDGWRMLHLGADVPAEDLVEAVERFHVDLVALSATLLTQLPAVRRIITVIRWNHRIAGARVLVGGAAFANDVDLAKQLGADGFAADAAEAVVVGRHLVGLSAE